MWARLSGCRLELGGKAPQTQRDWCWVMRERQHGLGGEAGRSVGLGWAQEAQNHMGEGKKMHPFSLHAFLSWEQFFLFWLRLLVFVLPSLG